MGAQGVHLRRALEAAGILTPQDFYDISPKGYRGAHYAVWPPELARRLIDEMCPRHVCTQCGEPRRRITETERVQTRQNQGPGFLSAGASDRTTVGWSDCGCCNHGHTTHNEQDGTLYCELCHSWITKPRWRPGRVLDPFVGSGTTLAVASGMARDSVGIDLDARNATLAYERVGMFLEVDGDMAEPDLSPASPAVLEPVVDVIEAVS